MRFQKYLDTCGTLQSLKDSFNLAEVASAWG